MSCITYIKNTVLCISVLIGVIIIFPGIPPNAQFSKHIIEDKLPLEGILAENSILEKTERLHEGHLIAPESIAVKNNNEIFVSTKKGDIVKLWGKNLENKKVISIIPQKTVGFNRPLGIKYKKDGNLIVLHGDYGIIQVNEETGNQEIIIDISNKIEDRKGNFPNHLDIDSTGNIYWSDASTCDVFTSLLANPNGRLICSNPVTKESTVLIDNLHVSNGVQLSKDESYVLVAELQGRRIRRYWLKGPKKGQSDIFISGLPGTPDNLSPRKEGGYYISLAIVDEPNGSFISQKLAQLPHIRKFLAKTVYIIVQTSMYIESIISNPLTSSFLHQIMNPGSIGNILNGNRAHIVEIDEKGKIIGSLQGKSGEIKFISETSRVGDCLIFGSFVNHYLGRLCDKSLFL